MPARRAGAVPGACLILFLGFLIWDCLVQGGPGAPVIAAAGGIAAICVGWLVVALVRARAEITDLQASAERLQNLTEQLEQSLAQLSAVNARLNASEARCRGLVDAQGDAICRRAPDGNLNYGNDAFFRLFGLEPENALGAPFAAESQPGNRSPGFAALAASNPAQERLRHDENVRTAYGWRWIAWEDYAVRDADGHLIEVQSVGRDVTERKALEVALMEARDTAESANRAKSRFLASMSHEIRTPMNGVLGMARLLLETPLSPDQKTYAAAIENSGQALLSLIDEILDFSRIEAGAIELTQGELDVRAVTEETVELLATRAHEKGIEIAAVIAPDVPLLVRADQARVRQILTNLVGNAVKFTEHGGVWVEVHTGEEREKRILRFSIHDTGIGVPAEMRAEIFREFVQADSTHGRRFGGSGLGLAIATRLVEAMDGAIGVQPRGEKGSTFWFSIPAPVLREHTPESMLPPDCMIAIASRNAMLREALAAQIRAAGGRAVTLDDSTRPQAQPQSIHAFLVDSAIAGTLELAAPASTHTHSIVLIAPAARGEIQRLRESGFQSYLVKPIRQASLAERLRDSPRGMAGNDISEPFSTNQGQKERAAGNLRVLLAEDNPVNILLTRELLRRRGHIVTEVTSGEGAIAAMARDDFDMLITDLHMPGVDGIEATRRIRAAEAASGGQPKPIVALTADVLDAGREACYEAGMNGFLAKPIAPAELDEMLERLFPNRSRAAAE